MHFIYETIMMTPPPGAVVKGLSHSGSWGESRPDLGSTQLGKSLAETSDKSLHLSETVSSSVKWGESDLRPRIISRVKQGRNRKQLTQSLVWSRWAMSTCTG